MQFSKNHAEAFHQLSGDRNPLHWNAEYSKRTQFGQVVLYGMASVLSALGAWAKGEKFQLLQIQGEFKKPIFLDEELKLEITDENNRVTAQFFRGNIVQSKFTWTYKAKTLKDQNSSEPFRNFRENLESTSPFSLSHFSYAFDSENAREALSVFNLSLGQLPSYQYATLLGSSYIVGMIYPGQQALYSGFKMEFEEMEEDTNVLDLAELSGSYDSRFRLNSIKGVGHGIKSFQLTAFQRPKNVSFPIQNMTGKKGERFHNKTVFISGSSRGFGSVMAKKMALEGAIVYLHYHSQKVDAEAVLTEILPFSPNSRIFQCDLTNPEEIKALSGKLKELPPLDILINNASANIRAQGFLEQSGADFMNFVSKSVAMYVNLTHELFSRLSPSGTVLNVSSVYTKAPNRQFTHYVASKSAIEGWTKALAQEFPKQHFVIAQLPKMLTDQTNVVSAVSGREDVSEAVTVADELVEFIANLHGPLNYHEFEVKKERATN